MTRRILFSTVWLTLFLIATTGHSFTGLYVFGDSLSDTGRNPAPSPFYYNGRYCNGPVWVEYLSAQLGLPYKASNNFAVSGSTTSDLLSQISGLAGFTNLQTGLFTVDSGGNDFLGSSSLGVDDSAWSTVVNNAVLNVSNAVVALYTNKAREILVGNLADLGKAPAFLSISASYASYVDTKVALFNSLLGSTFTNLMQHNTGLRIYLLDNNLELKTVLSAPSAYGFTVTTNGALEDSHLADKSFAGPGANYIFWDVIHPTTKLAALVGAMAFNSVGVQLKVQRSGANLNLLVSNLYPTFPYTVQSSTNLTSWSTYNAFTATNTARTLTLTNGPAKNVFYRMQY